MVEEITTSEQLTPGAEDRKSFLERSIKNMPSDILPIVVLILVVFLVILYANDWKFWDGMTPLEVTNDAYVRSDVTPLSTKVAGTVARVLIDDFDHVYKGQLLIELRNDDFIANERQKKSIYDEALAQIETIKQQINEQKEHIEIAKLSVNVGRQDITRSVASVGATEATLQAAIDSLAEVKAEKAQAEAKLKADEALALRAKQERAHQEELFADHASTQQTIEQVVADYDRANAIVVADGAEINRLSNVINKSTAEIAGQRQELNSAHAEDVQSRLRVSSDDAALRAEHNHLDVLTKQLKEAQSHATSSLEAWNQAKVELDYTQIRAPVDGILSERRVKLGHLVNAGTQVVTIVSSVPWVIASYRETQMRKIDVGDKAEVTVDALGGAMLKGKVQSLSPASEAQFALLPPDNPSGNFTKITQRLPIKIVFNEGQKNLSRIKPGMTVIAKVWTR